MSKADVVRWAQGHALAERRIQREARRSMPDFSEALERVDDLRVVADALGATVDARRYEAENLAFHLTWASVRRAFGR